jgi:hypothetical protein
LTSAAEAAFASAARAAADALALPAVAERWGGPSALDGMTVGALAAHLDAGTTRLEHFLAEPEPTEGPVLGIGAYFGINRIDGPATASDDPAHALIRLDAAQRAEAGVGVVRATFDARIDRLVAVLAVVPPDRLVPCRVPGARARSGDLALLRACFRGERAEAVLPVL